MKLANYIVLIILICWAIPAFAQIEDRVDKQELAIKKKTITKSKVGFDTIPKPSLDTLGIQKPRVSSGLNVPISKDAMDIDVTYGCEGKEWVDIKNDEIHLKKKAYVRHDDVEITAGYIIFDFKKNEALAMELSDDVGTPQFTQGGQTVQYKKLRYNFKSGQGLVYNAISRQGEYFVHGAVTKFVKQNPDSLIYDDAIYNKNALITTCNHKHPHYGIRTSKLKVIPNKLAIIGPANLEIAGLPTPLFIPFALAPLFSTPSGRSGIIFGGQQGVEYSPTLGLGFRGVGYHFAINDYVNLGITADIYTRGTWGLQLNSSYAKRYKYRGSVQFGYTDQKIEVIGERDIMSQKAFSFRLSHDQDPKAHPYIKIGGSFRFQTNDFQRRNRNDADAQFTNVISSNFNFTHTMPSLDAWNFNMALTHSQNTLDNSIRFGLPEIGIRMNTVYPFKKNRGGNKERWYEKINMQYNSQFRNYVETVDSILFTQETLDKLQTGMSHKASAGASFQILKYFNLTPSVNYEEYWFVKTLDKSFDTDSIRLDSVSLEPIFMDSIRVDTIRGAVVEEFNFGFRRFNTFNANVNLSTNLFNTARFKRGWLRGLRQTIKPSIGLSFAPNTLKFQEVVINTFLDTIVDEFNPFAGGVFNVPRLRERQMAMTYSINNIFEGKYYSRRDSTEKKFKIFDNLRFSGNYNFAADSLNWSEIIMAGTARFLNNIVLLTIGASFDPYIKVNGRRVNITNLSQNNRLLRFDRFSARLAVNFKFKDIRKLLSGDPEPAERENRDDKPKALMEDSIWDMIDNFTVGYNIQYMISTRASGKVYEFTTNSLAIQGTLPLTKNWNLRVNNLAYDFDRFELVYPDIGISRDLHCWEASFSWQPRRGTYLFNIGVKTSDLASFLKYDYFQNQFERR